MPAGARIVAGHSETGTIPPWRMEKMDDELNILAMFLATVVLIIGMFFVSEAYRQKQVVETTRHLVELAKIELLKNEDSHAPQEKTP